MLTGAINLLVNASATGAGVTWHGGEGVLTVCGTFGGASVSLQTLGPDGVTWIDVGTSTTLTSAGAPNFRLPQGQIRVAVTGGTPSGLYARAARVLV